MDSQALLDIINADTDVHISFLQRFTQAPSPNPPGDTRAAAAVIQEYLTSRNISTRFISPGGEHLPNIVSEFNASAKGDDGPRLVMNGHIDVFPAGDGHDWDRSPWSGEIIDGRLHGRGTVDMKAGTAASVIAFAYLHRYREHLKGSVVLSAVSDEETGGRFGTKWLLNHDDEGDDSKLPEGEKGRWAGDVVINAEPGGLNTIRFAEKGTLRLTFTVDTGAGAHGAFTHLSKSATRIAARLINDLAVVEDIEPDVPADLRAYLQREEVRRTIDECMGAGAADISLKTTLNIGKISGGLKVNMIPGRCDFEGDIRMPLGLTRDRVLEVIHKVLEGYPEARVEVQEAASNAASASVHDHRIVDIIARQTERATGKRPLAIPSLGGTDCKHYRYRGVPAYVLGVYPDTMGAKNESVSIEEFLAVVKAHTLTGWEFLGGRL